MSIFSAFLEGFSGGSLLSWAKLPGSASQIFADENSTQPQEELVTLLQELQKSEDSQGTEEYPPQETCSFDRWAPPVLSQIPPQMPLVFAPQRRIIDGIEYVAVGVAPRDAGRGIIHAENADDLDLRAKDIAVESRIIFREPHGENK